MSDPNAHRTSSASTDAVQLQVPTLPQASLVIGPFTAAAVALLAGLLAWCAIEQLDPVFQVPADVMKLSPQPTSEEIERLDAAEAVVTRKHTAVWLAILGGLAGLFLSAVESRSRVSIRRTAVGALLATVICAVMGAVSGFTSQLLYQELTDYRELTPMARTIIMQSYMLVIFGLGLGLAIGLPLLQPRLLMHCVLGCILGGVMAAIVYAPSVGYLLPRVRTESVFPQTSEERLLWISLVMALIGLTVAGLGGEKRARQKARSMPAVASADG